MAKVVRCFQYRLRPTPEQERQFRQWAGCRRFIWNHFRERRQEHYRATGKRLSYAEMCQELTLLKQQEEYAFLNDCDSQALQQVLKDLCAAYMNFFERRARFPLVSFVTGVSCLPPAYQARIVGALVDVRTLWLSA